MSDDAEFMEFPKSKFPLRLVMFDTHQDVVWDSGEVDGPAAIPIPGLGPGSVRYSLYIFGDGEVSLRDDPTCSGTVKEWSAQELSAKVDNFLRITQEWARETLEKGSKLATVESIESPIGVLLHSYFERQVGLAEKMLEAVDYTHKLLKEGSGEHADSRVD